MKHLTNNNFNVFIVDFYTLRFIYFLYFVYEVTLCCLCAHYTHDVMRINGTFCQTCAQGYNITVFNDNARTIRDEVIEFNTIFTCNKDSISTFFTFVRYNTYYTFIFSNDCITFWFTSFEQFFNTRQTLCDIVTCDTACMECTHCQLCTRFTDGLSRNDTNCFTDLNLVTCTKVTTIALTTYAIRAATSQYGTDFNNIVMFYNFISKFFSNFTIQWNDNFTSFLID